MPEVTPTYDITEFLLTDTKPVGSTKFSSPGDVTSIVLGSRVSSHCERSFLPCESVVVTSRLKYMSRSSEPSGSSIPCRITSNSFRGIGDKTVDVLIKFSRLHTLRSKDFVYP